MNAKTKCWVDHASSSSISCYLDKKTWNQAATFSISYFILSLCKSFPCWNKKQLIL